MTPADMAAGIAPGPRTDASCGDDDAGTRSLLPPTRRTERVAVDPGPMPPRWSRVSDGGPAYLHDNRPICVVVRDDAWLNIVGSIALSEADDLTDLVRWLRRGGR